MKKNDLGGLWVISRAFRWTLLLPCVVTLRLNVVTGAVIAMIETLPSMFHHRPVHFDSVAPTRPISVSL